MSKVVLITGTSSGLGRASAEFLAKNGYKVYATSRNVIDFSNTNITPMVLDITSQKSIDKAVKYIIKKENRIDVLVNNAGYGTIASVEKFKEEEMLNQFNINVFGVLRLSKAVIPYMRKANQGIIINISSFLGKVGLPLLTLYNSSKYAVEGITDSLRYELRDFNIRVHSIMPGFFNTEFAKKNLVVNSDIFKKSSAYYKLASKLIPNISQQINGGNDAKEVAKLILQIINDENFPARVTVGDKSKKFIPMRKELSDEDFERRVREYYGI